jgi:hypothetical protein
MSDEGGKTHRISVESTEQDNSTYTLGESDESDLHSLCESGLGGDESSDTGEAGARRKQAPTWAGVPSSDHFITKACDGVYHKVRKINSAEGEPHLPAGGSQQPSTCFFPAQDNIVCHSPSDSYRLLSPVTVRASDSLGHDGSPGRQRWNDGAHP